MTLPITRHQCDQMAWSFVQYLGTYNIDFQIAKNCQRADYKLWKIINTIPKDSLISQSDEMSSNLVTLLVT